MSNKIHFPDYTKWKAVRQLTTRSLTPAKIKAMTGSMKETLQDFMTDLKIRLKENGDKPLSMDVRE